MGNVGKRNAYIQLRQRKEQNEWLTYKPLPSLRPDVICFSNGEVFKSCQSVEKVLGISGIGVRLVCGGKNHHAGGHKWGFLSDCVEPEDIGELLANHEHSCYVKIRDFRVKMHLKLNPHSYSARKAKAIDNNPVAVRCCETGIVYSSMGAAARAVGIKQSCISRALNYSNYRAGGYHWEVVRAGDYD